MRAYCKERNNDIDPEVFVAFYESKGWKVGKTPMKNWKSAVVTWEKRGRSNAIQAVKKVIGGSQTPSNYIAPTNEALKKAQRMFK